MPWYSYTAIDEAGNLKKHSDYFLSKKSFLEETKNINVISYRKVFFKSFKIKKQHVIDFSFYMHKLLSNKIPLIYAIDFSIEALPSMKNILSNVRKKLNTGEKFSEILKIYPKVFDKIFIAHIEFGESIGKLDAHFKYIYDYLILKNKTKKTIKNSLIYPAIIGIFIFILLFCTHNFILPEFIKFLTIQDKPLPGSTTFLINFIKFTVTYFPIILISTFAFMLLCYKFQKYLFDTIILHIPFIGPLVFKHYLSLNLQIIAIFLKERLPILQILKKITKSTPNLWMQKKFELIENDMIEGKSFHEAFSRILGNANIIKIAEQNNFLSETLERIAEIQIQEMENTLNKVMKYLEPTLIVVFGFIIILIILAVWNPIYDTI